MTSRRPRVLRLITRLNVGGPATHVTVADRGLRRHGWETLLAFGTVEPDEVEIDLHGIDIDTVRIPSLARPIRPLADLRAAASVAGMIRRYRPDVIHSHLSKAGLIGRAVAMAVSPAIRVHTFHGTVFGSYFGATTSGAILRAERFLGARTHAVVAISPRQRDELLENRIAPADAIEVIPLGLPLGRFTPAGAPGAREVARDRLGIPRDAFVVVAVGRIVPIKRLDRLVDAFARVAADVPGAHLYIVGGGGERAALEGRVAAAGLVGRVTFAGWSAATPDWYAATDVVALTSEREGTPLALIEAAAAGRPVVATDVGGVADVVEDGVTGFVVPADDVVLLANRVMQLARDPALRQSMSLAAPERAAGYAEDRLVGDLDRLYRTTLDSTKRRRSTP